MPINLAGIPVLSHSKEALTKGRFEKLSRSFYHLAMSHIFSFYYRLDDFARASFRYNFAIVIYKSTINKGLNYLSPYFLTFEWAVSPLVVKFFRVNHMFLSHIDESNISVHTFFQFTFAI